MPSGTEEICYFSCQALYASFIVRLLSW